MKVSAFLKHARYSSRKARLVADLVRGLDVGQAAVVLRYCPAGCARPMSKLLLSAVANAENNFALDVDSLWIDEVVVDRGPFLTRLMPRAKGRGDQIKKPTCSIRLVLSDAPRRRRGS